MSSLQIAQQEQSPASSFGKEVVKNGWLFKTDQKLYKDSYGYIPLAVIKAIFPKEEIVILRAKSITFPAMLVFPPNEECVYATVDKILGDKVWFVLACAKSRNMTPILISQYYSNGSANFYKTLRMVSSG